jgi:DNA-directed RNA polymerase
MNDEQHHAAIESIAAELFRLAHSRELAADEQDRRIDADMALAFFCRAMPQLCNHDLIALADIVCALLGLEAEPPMRDEDAGRYVNLFGDLPQDLYRLFVDRVIDRLKAAGDEWADWWLWVGITRELVKQPVMTFPYSVTEYGMRSQIAEAYAKLHEGAEPTDAARNYLAKHIWVTCKEILPRPAAAMEFIRMLAEERADKNEILQWKTSTGFPVANRHFESKVELVHIESRGEYVRHNVADGYEPNVLKRDAMNAAAPNVVHSLDATLMARVALAADRVGILMFGVHDSMAFRAPEAREGRVIINREFAKLYSERDVLDDLRKSAGSNLALPDRGSLDPLAVQTSPYAFA